MLTCLDLAWATVGPFFLRTVTVSQSLSAMFPEVHSIPVISNIDTKISSVFKTSLLKKEGSGVGRSFQNYHPHALSQSFIYNTVVNSDVMEAAQEQQRPLLVEGGDLHSLQQVSTVGQDRVDDGTFKTHITSDCLLSRCYKISGCCVCLLRTKCTDLQSPALNN